MNRSNKRLPEGCLLNDGSVFMGQASITMGEEVKSAENIRVLFSTYKEGLLKNLEENTDPKYLEEFEKYFYVPKLYYLFGKFDLCAFALTEEFYFGSKSFRPYNVRSQARLDISTGDNVDFGEPFQKQVFLGPTPRFDESKNITDLYSKIDPRNPQFPLISVTRIKLNDLLLLPLGAKLIRAAIITFLNQLGKGDQKFGYFILESYTWSELILVVQQYKYDTIFDLLPEIREVKLEKILREEAKNGDNLGPLKAQLEVANIGLDPSLLNDLLDFPLVVHTSTSLGFDFEIFDYMAVPSQSDHPGKRLFDSIEAHDLITPVSKWFTKTGSLSEAILRIYNEGEKGLSDIDFSTGQGDIIYPKVSDTQSKNIPTKVFIAKHCNIRLTSKESLSVSSSYTILSKNRELPKKFSTPDSVPKEDTNVKSLRIFRKFEFSNVFIGELHKNLKSLLVPKIIQSGILNLISLYNSGIRDSILFANFVELHPFIHYVNDSVKEAIDEAKSLKENTSYPLENIHHKLDIMLHSFMYAFHNRFHGSYLTGEINEFNIFFDGGIHQLVTAFDGLYKTTSKIFSNPNSFVYVEGDPIFSTSEWALRLNYFHIFHPEKLAAVIFQESAIKIPLKYRDVSPEVFRYHKYQNPRAQFIIDADLKENLKREKIEKVFEKYIEFLTPGFFEHVFADMVGFQLLYLRNYDLFSFWSWGYYAANSFIYHKKGDHYEMNETKFLKFLLRQLLVFKFCREDKEKPYEFLFYYDFKDLYDEHYNDVNRFIELFLFHGQIARWFEQSNAFIEKLSRKVLLSSVAEYQEKSKIPVENNKQSFKNGEVIIFKDSSSETIKENLYFQHIQSLVYAYLDLLFEKANENSKEGSSKILTRINGRPKLMENDSKLLFDPAGGIFVVDGKIRRELYLYRSVFHSSVWDLSMKQKWDYLRQLIIEDDLSK